MAGPGLFQHFFARTNILAGFQGSTGFRQLFTGPGFVQSFAMSIELASSDLFAAGFYFQIHDSNGSPLGGGPGLASVPVHANRIPVFLDDGYEVTDGAVLVVSINVTQFDPPVSVNPGAFISSAVVFV